MTRHARRGKTVLTAQPVITILAVLVSVTAVLLPRSSDARRAARPAALATSCPVQLAQVRFIQGGLVVQPPKQKAGKGKVKQQLFQQYLLRTGSKQKSSICFKDGTLLHLNQRTDALLKSPNLTYVSAGEVDQILAPGSNHRIQTATAIATAIGTNVDVKVERVKKNKKHSHEKVKRTRFVVVEGALIVEANGGRVLVTTGEKTTVDQGKKPAAPTPADTAKVTGWTDTIPPPKTPLGMNVALSANGGFIAGVSSARDAGPPFSSSSAARVPHQTGALFAPQNLIDGNPAVGWQSAQGQTSEQFIKFGFAGGGLYHVTGVVLTCAATSGQAPDNAMKDFEIRLSQTDSRGQSFDVFYAFTCKQSDKPQLFTIGDDLARYVEIFAHNNHGGSAGIALAEVQIISTTNPPVLGTPTPTATTIPTNTPVPTVAPTSTKVPTAVPTNTLVPTNVPVPTNTFVPTATSTPVPPTPTSTTVPTIRAAKLEPCEGQYLPGQGIQQCGLFTTRISGCDSGVGVQVTFSPWIGTFTLRAQFQAPDGTVYRLPDYTATNNGDVKVIFSMQLAGTSAESKSGTWNFFLVTSTGQVVGSASFTLSACSAPATPRPTLTRTPIPTPTWTPVPTSNPG